MKHSIYIVLAAFIMNACNSKDSSSENKSNELIPVPIEQITMPKPVPTQDTSTSGVGNTDYGKNSSADSKQGSYNDGYKFGYDMGYIDGQENRDYNGSLPVGPNTASYTYEYRCGYAAGYSAGYEAAQQNSHLGIYEEEDDDTYYEEY